MTASRTSTLSTPEGRDAARAIAEYLREHPLRNRDEILAGTGADPRLFDTAYQAGWFRAVDLGYVSDDWMQRKMHHWAGVNPARMYTDRQTRATAARIAAREYEVSRERLGIPFPCPDGQ